jgi:ribosomal protein L11 methyltransferase
VQTEAIAPTNWNATWEQHYEPVRIPPLVQVLADFHEPEPGYRFTVRLHPRMAFGTGHHATTRLVLEALARLEAERPLTGLTVLDYGCGTGLLGLVAAAMGAVQVELIDIDPVATENTALNLGLNADLLGEAEMRVSTAVLDDLPPGAQYDIVLANINRFVHEESLTRYSTLLNPGGTLLLSGVLPTDEAIIRPAFEATGWLLAPTEQQEGWLCIRASRAS